ncbi:filamentous hemagglutinin N-terminal domain-containing protein, partial [Pseudomonas fontis]
MDVRYFAFLARQRAAAIQPRESFCGLPKRGLALLLANVMFWQPMWAQAAEGIVVSAPGTALNQAGNGVPIVKIAAPNGSGLSHNQFVDYNVGSNGVILNNATGRTQDTQLGGIILGNPNLQGTAATTILNEVNGGNPSQLRGYTEVAGQSAKVIVANPYGISCNGCGFINTPQVTLTTGKPVINAQGAVGGYQVDGGSVSLEGAGLNAGNVGRFDIITRSAKLNAQLHAQELNVITGRNDVDAQTLAATPRAGAANDAPALAIDSSALGGMYAGAIKLVGTEAGVGVRLAGDLIASGGDIQLDANGHVSLAQTSATGAVNVKAASLDAQGPLYAETSVQVSTAGNLTNQNNIAARDSITLNAGGTLSNRGVIEAGVEKAGTRNTQGDITVTAQNLDNTGKTLVASRDLTITSNTAVANQGGTLSAARNSQLTAATLDNSNNGRLLANQAQHIVVSQELNNQGGLISAGRSLTVDAGHLVNRNGELSSLLDGTLRLHSLDNVAGLASATQGLTITAQGVIDNQGGRLSAGTQLSLDATQVDNRNAGRIASSGTLTARITGLDQRGGGQLHASKALSLDLQHGLLNNDDAGLITTPGQLSLQRLGAVSNQRGEISSEQAFTLQAQQLDNTAGKLLSSSDLNVLIAGQLNNSAGLIAANTLQLHAAALFNTAQAKVHARAGLTAKVSGTLNNQAGQLLANSDASLTVGSLDNSAGGRISSGQALTLDLGHGRWNNDGGWLNAPGALLLRNLAQVSNRTGEISSASAYTLQADQLDNQGGKLLSEQGLTLRITQVLDNSKGLISANGIDLQALSLNNLSGTLTARETLGVVLQQALDNRNGKLLGKYTSLASGDLDNRSGRVQGDATLVIDSSADIDNRSGTLVAGQRLKVTSAELKNSQGEVSSSNTANITTGTLNNANGRLEAFTVLTLTAGQVSNTDAGRISAGKVLDASMTGLEQARGGRLFSGADLSLDLKRGHLDNQGGVINAPGLLLLKQLGLVSNTAGELSSSQAFELVAERLDNSSGKLISEQGLTLRIAQALNNAKGTLSAATLDLRATALDNRAGMLSAVNGLDLLLTGELNNQGGEVLGRDVRLTLDTLDNQQGRVHAERTLTLTSHAGTDNQTGKLRAGQHLELHAASLDNRQGELLGDASLTARIAGQLLNQSGLLGASGALLLYTDSLGNQAGGRILGKADVELNARHLDNRGGTVAADGAATLKVTALDNQGGAITGQHSLLLLGDRLDNSLKGRIEAKGPLQITMGVLNNRTEGKLLSSDSLTLIANEIDNAENGRIASSKTLRVDTGRLDQHAGGKLTSERELTLDLRNGHLDNQGGLIHAQGPLLFKRLAVVDNRKGEISSDLAFDLNALHLNNNDGQLISARALTVTVAEALLNLKGVIGAAGLKVVAASLDNSGGTLGSDVDLGVEIAGALLNQQGEVSSAGNTVVAAASLDNRNGAVTGDVSTRVHSTGKLDNRAGMLGAGEQLDITADSLDNRDGSLVSDGRLKASVTGVLDNSAKGKVLAKRLLELSAGHLSNQAGLVSGRDLLTLRAGKLDNAAGLVHADQYLQLFVDNLDNSKGVVRSKAALDYHGQHLINTGGLLTADGAVLLDAREVDNAKGRIASRSDLLATVGILRQQSGALVSEGTLALTADEVSVGVGGVIASSKDLTLNVGTLDNLGGELSSLMAVAAHGKRFNNSGGKLIAGTALTLTVEHVINRSKGLLFGQNTRLTGARLDNDGGTVGGTLSLHVDLVSRSLPLLDGLLDNRAGRLDSEGTLTITSVSLDNDGGKVSSLGALQLTNSGALSSRAGLIETDGGLIVTSASLDNRDAGLISSQGDALVTTGALNNSQGGRIKSHDLLTLYAGQVTNQAKGSISGKVLDANLKGLEQQGGELFSLGDLTLDLNSGHLDNQGGLIHAPGALLLKQLDSVANQGGEISSTQSFELAARSLDTSAGKLLSTQQLTVRVSEQLNAIKGLIAARSLHLHADNLNNRDGLISSRETAELRIKGELANLGGTVLSDGTLLLRAGSVVNSAGKLSSKQDVDAQFGKLDNQNGQVIAEGELRLGADHADNRQAGLLKATKALKLTVDDLDNRGGEIAGDADVSLTGTRLDNRDNGQVLAAGGLALTLQNTLNQNNGLLQGISGLTLNAQGPSSRLDNSGGMLRSDARVRVDLNGEVINNSGRITSDGTLTVNSARLDNTAGRLSSTASLVVNSTGAVLNQRGTLLSEADASLTSTSFDNSQGGMLSAQGPLVITTGLLENQQKGRIGSGSRLDLTSAMLNNSSGGRIASSGVLVASVSALEQQGGELYSAAGLDLDLNNGQLNNQGGLINTPGQLLLKNLNGVANQGGEISSAQAFALAAQQLNNDNGKLLGNQGLTLTVNQALSNLKGKIAAAALTVSAGSLSNGNAGVLTSRSDLGLTVNGLLDNSEAGLINAQQALTISAGSVNNQGGELLASTHLGLTAGTLDNSAKGLINSTRSLTLKADELLNGSAGEVSAKEALSLNVGSLKQQGGRVLGDAALTVNLAVGGGDLDNQSGLLHAKGPLTINNLRELNNRTGEISSTRQFTLAGRTLDNRAGKLISNEALTLDAATLLNQGGLISGWNGLTVTGGSLANSNSGTLSSRAGSVDVRLSGALDNSVGGALASQGRLDVTAASLNNQAGIIVSAGGQSLKTVAGTLDNRQRGQIDSGAGLDIWAGNLLNADGTIIGLGPVTLERLAQLNNRQGKIISGNTLRVLGNAAVDNQGGTLISQASLELNGASLDNRNKGTVAAATSVALTTSGAVLNDTDGLIHSQGADVKVVAQRLSNQAGGLQGQTGLSVDVREDLGNQGGKILAQTGNLLLKAGSVDNRGGVLASLKGELETRVNGLVRNDQGGVIQAQQLKLIALGGTSNVGGRIAAQSGNISVETANFANQGGGLFAKGLVTVLANDLDNSGGGQIAGQRLDFGLRGALVNRGGIIESDSSLDVAAVRLDNQGGQLRALGKAGKTAFAIGGVLDNQNGVIESANDNLSLQAASFLNSSGKLLHGGAGEFEIGMANVTGAGGEIVTLGGLTLNAASWTNSSVIQAGRLNVNVGEFTQTETGQLLASSRFVGSGGNWVNRGVIASDGSLSLNVQGGYTSSGQITSLGSFDLTANSLQLLSTGRIAGGRDVTVSTSGQLNNLGRLTAGNTLKVNAQGLTNNGTLGSAGGLEINAQTLLNQGAGESNRSLISSGGDMALRVGDFTNRFATVYSLGGLVVARDAGNNRANRVENISATLQSGGAMAVFAQNITNRKDAFSVSEKLVSGSITYVCHDCKGRHYDLTYEVIEEFERTVTADSGAASISAGTTLAVQSDVFENKHSLVSAATGIDIATGDFLNEGASTESVNRVRTFRNPSDSERSNVWDSLVREGGAVAEYAKYNSKTQYVYQRQVNSREGSYKTVVDQGRQNTGRENPNYRPDSGYVVPAQILSYQLSGTREDSKSTGVSASAIVQSGGNVSINASRNLGNGVTRSNTSYSTQAQSGADTSTSGKANPNVSTINSQLPPDLAQRQVNPLSLPGFAIPTGQNGLFRLSAEAGTANGATQVDARAQQWSLGTGTIDLAQREKVLPAIAGRAASAGDIAQVAVSSRELGDTVRQGLGIDTRASVVKVDQVGAAATSPGVPGRTIELPGASRPDLVTVDGAGVLLPGTGATSREPLVINQPNPSAGTSLVLRDVSGAIVSPGSTSTPATGIEPIRQPEVVTNVGTPVGPQTIARVQGLPDNSGRSQPHKYLIETNPVLTDLKTFMSSDYLLGNLGYDPDKSWKRLGDGYFEQQLIQQAVAARTGQRFIDGKTSDEAIYKHLMDNALTSKQQLDLRVGVTLTAQQVAALTHDIVWLEEHEVSGEKVLVPVLYLAHANNRLAPNGALIQGADLNLIAGAGLSNGGTLRASNNLSASAGKNLINSGLIEAGNRLELLAGDSIVNGAGGIISGRDVSMTALLGDVINERTVSVQQTGSQTRHNLDTAARIEAANDLSIGAGRDMLNIGSELQAGRDLKVDAGRDLALTAAELRFKDDRGRSYQRETITQFGSSVEAGRDATFFAGRDFAAIGSDIEVKRNLAIDALNDLTLASAANEDHFYSKTKKVTRQEDHIRQLATQLTAGGNIDLAAGNDLALVSSRITAGDEAYLVAGDKLELLAAQDSDYSLYDMKKKGSWGKKKTQRDEVTDVRNVGSEITTGGDLTLESGGDQRYQVAKLTSGDDLTLESGGDINFAGVKDLHQESHEKSKNSLAWTSGQGKGRTDETLRQSEIVAQGDLVIQAVGKIQVDVKQINQQSVAQSIDAMVKADPKLAWLKDVEAQGGVDWRQVEEIHTSFKYSHSGLGAGAQLALAILMAALMGPVGLGLSAVPAAGAASLATTAVNSAVSNKGDLGAVLKDTLSKESLKSATVAMVTAGALEYVDAKWFSAADGAQSGAINVKDGVVSPANASSKNVLTWSNASDTLIRAGTHAVISSGVSTTINGGSFSDNLGSALVGQAGSIAMATGFKWVGDNTIKFDNGSVPKIFAHAIMGGLLAEATGSDFKTGAMAAGLNEAMVNGLTSIANGNENVHMMLSQLTGVVAAAAVGGDLEKGMQVAQSATAYNHQLHRKNAENFATALMDACEKVQGYCSPEYKTVTQEELVDALEVTAKHGEGIDRLNPVAKQLVSQFLDRFDDTKETLFLLTPSERERLDVVEKAELAISIMSLGTLAKSAVKPAQNLVERLLARLRSVDSAPQIGPKGTA